jgi:hypothetical protein
VDPSQFSFAHCLDKEQATGVVGRALDQVAALLEIVGEGGMDQIVAPPMAFFKDWCIVRADFLCNPPDATMRVFYFIRGVA